MKLKFTIAMMILILLAACGKGIENEGQTYYHFTGKIVGIVNQTKEPIHKQGINYTLTLDQFNPTGAVFDKYNRQFSDDYKDGKYVEITKRTSVFVKEGDTKIPVNANTLKPGDLVEIWYHPFMEGRSIEAMEINNIK